MCMLGGVSDLVITHSATPAPLTDTDATAARVAAAWLLAHRDSTRRVYRGDITRYTQWLAGYDVGLLEAERAHVDAYIATLRREGKSPATIKRVICSLSSFYTYAVKDARVIKHNPCERVRRPKIYADHSPTQAPDLDEAKEMLRWAERDGPRTLVIVHLGLTVGLRAAEIAGARYEHLSTERGHRVLTVTRKGGFDQKLVLPAPVWHAIERCLAGRTSGPLVATRTGRPMATSEIYRTVRRVAKLAGIDKHIHPHSLRHACATLALDAGADLRDVQDLLGHADPRTTRRYDRARHRLDRSPSYAIATALAS